MLNLLAQVDIGKNFFWKDQGGGVWAGLPSSNEVCFSSISAFISCVLPNVYVFSGIILFVLMVIGGFIVITSAGKGDQEGTKKGQKAITAALIGFLIIFTSYWIIQIIEKVTGLKILSGHGL